MSKKWSRIVVVPFVGLVFWLIWQRAGEENSSSRQSGETTQEATTHLPTGRDVTKAARPNQAQAKASGISHPPATPATPAESLGDQQSLDPAVAGPWTTVMPAEAVDEANPSTATVDVSGKSFRLQPNQQGHFQRVYVPPASKIAVAVAFSNGQPGDKIALRLLDGGEFSNHNGVMLAQLDGQRVRK
jgi:hypothetical protein